MSLRLLVADTVASHVYPAGQGGLIRYGPAVPALFAAILVSVVSTSLWLAAVFFFIGIAAVAQTVLKANDFAQTVEISNEGLTVRTFWNHERVFTWGEIASISRFPSYFRGTNIHIMDDRCSKRVVLPDALTDFDELEASLRARIPETRWTEDRPLWLRLRYGQ